MSAQVLALSDISVNCTVAAWTCVRSNWDQPQKCLENVRCTAIACPVVLTISISKHHHFLHWSQTGPCFVVDAEYTKLSMILIPVNWL